MKKPILSVIDESGNIIPIPAIRGKPGITPHIGVNGNWWIGQTDTGISVYKLPYPLVIMQGMTETTYDGSEEVVINLSDSSGGGFPPIEEDAPTVNSPILEQSGDEIRCFNTITCMGDSLTAGNLDYNTLLRDAWETVTPTWNAGKILYDRGEVKDYSSTNYVVSEAIPVTPGDVYKITAGIKYKKAVLAFYNSSDGFVSQLISTTDDAFVFEDEIVTVPGDAAYMRVGNLNTVVTFALYKRNHTRKDRGEVKIPGTSYPEQLSKMTGITTKTCGIGGLCATNSAVSIADGHSFIDVAQNRGWFVGEYVSQAYIIALGTNDISYYGAVAGDVSTDIDSADYNNNAPTFVGGYAGIIQRILEVQPQAKIFCVTIPRTRNVGTPEESMTAFNNGIAAVAGMFGCYVIDLRNEVAADEVNAFKAAYYTGNHLNARGYALHARNIISHINRIIRQHPEEFRTTAFIGTDYAYTIE